ncbi:hypothetical protein OG21DRAFT_397915 [Imleria badia]|nr:hypothetical protein OG21DRAFT_397915 [Imleria badia]
MLETWTSLHPCARPSLLQKKTLNRYYELTDSSDVYRIAMVLHPRHKLQYFRQANWEQDWINTAEELVREEYNRTYKSIADDPDQAQELDKSAENGTKKVSLAHLGCPRRITMLTTSSQSTFLTISLL